MTTASIKGTLRGRPRRWLALMAASSLIALSLFAIPRQNLDQTLAAQYEIVQSSPNDPMAYNDLGNLLMLAGLELEAEAVYQRAIELDPGAREPRFNRALLFQQSGRIDEARMAFTELIEADPKDAWSWYQLGVILDDEKQRDKAIDHYARAFALDPSLTFARTNPHIIDNDLSTEALLVSSKYSASPGSLVPRHYHDRSRIQRGLIGPDLENRTEMEPPATTTSQVRVEGGRSEEDPGAVPGVQTEEVEPEPNRLEDDEQPVTRVIGNDDLDSGSSIGQVVNSRRGSSSRRATRNSASSGRSSQRQETSTRSRRQQNERGSGTTSDGRASGRDNGRATTGRPFQPGRVSTGRLEIDLLPPESKESRYTDAQG